MSFRSWCHIPPRLPFIGCKLGVNKGFVMGNLDVREHSPYLGTRLQMFSSSDSTYMFPINLPQSRESPSCILVDSTNSRYYIPADDGSDNINIYSATKDSTPLMLQGCLSARPKNIGAIHHMVLQEGQLFAVDWLYDCIHVFDWVTGEQVKTFGKSEMPGKLYLPGRSGCVRRANHCGFNGTRSSSGLR